MRAYFLNFKDVLNGRGGVLILVFLHLLIAVPLAIRLNIWVDEASTLYTTERGIFHALQNALTDEKQAPLYFWFLSLWRTLGGSIFFARAFSILCALLAIKFFFDLARRIFDEKTARFISVLFALHPFLFWASLEIRVYSAVILLSAVLLNLWFENYFDQRETDIRRKGELVFILVSISALYTNYYLGFLLAGLFTALLVLRKWPEAKRFFVQMVAVGVFFAPLLWALKSQFAANTVAFQSERTLTVGLQLLWNNFLIFVLPTEIFPVEQLTTVSLVRVWLVRLAIIVLAFVIVKKRREIFDDKLLALGTVSASILIFLLTAYLLLGEVYVAIRHAAVLFVPLVLFVGLVLARTLPSKSRIVLTFIYGFLFVYSLVMLYPNTAKRGDWARVGAYLEQNEKPHQPIIVFTTFDALALPYHYKGVNKILPDEKFFDWEIEAPLGTPDAWRRQTEFIISEIPKEADELWLVTNEKCAVKDSCRPLENFIEAHYTVIAEKEFYLEKIRLLRRKKND